MLAATTSPTPPSTKRRRTSSSSSPLPPPLGFAALDTAIRTPHQLPSRRHRPAIHPRYHRSPRGHSNLDGAVLIGLAIGLRSPPPPSASAAPSARRDTPPQIARRHPAPRIISPRTSQPTTQALHIPLHPHPSTYTAAPPAHAPRAQLALALSPSPCSASQRARIEATKTTRTRR
ncbi:hypothetical protein DFH09DRAFT_1321912 [Mycena vulgaris]|nr:hypothetical protein DFH09DRAFT_1321912 [Mycena vulgaris]